VTCAFYAGPGQGKLTLAVTPLDLGNLRPLLDEEEAYAKSIAPGDPRAAIARRMLAVIAEARGSLRPSADSTANYVPNKQIVEELISLRYEADLIGARDKKGGTA
jgi:hypothetical protein